jgi:hypothetical protein
LVWEFTVGLPLTWFAVDLDFGKSKWAGLTRQTLAGKGGLVAAMFEAWF